MKRALGLGIALLVLGLLGCGDDDSPNDPTDPGNLGGTSMTATIDGQSWSGSAGVSGGPGSARTGTLVITGTKLNPQSIVSLTLSFVNGPGTYPLGVNYLTNSGGVGSYSKSGFWSTPFSGAAGTVTVTTRTATRIAGTFSFTAEASAGTPPSTVVVTNGQFDITKAAGLPALPTGIPSEMIATLNGFAWSAATILAVAPAQSVGGTTTQFAVELSSLTPFTAGQRYKIGPQALLSINQEGTNDSWEVVSQDSVGYVTIATVTAERLIGSFAGTLSPVGTASSPMVVTNGAFDVHLQ